MAAEVIVGTDPFNPDTDGDDLLDGTEVDTGGGTGCPNPVSADSDGDTISDGNETVGGTNPCNADTDGDGVAHNLDPWPTQPGVTTGCLEDSARQLADDIRALDLALFIGPNNNANKGRRNALANRAMDAANKIPGGDVAAAFQLIEAVQFVVERVGSGRGAGRLRRVGEVGDLVFDGGEVMAPRGHAGALPALGPLLAVLEKVAVFAGNRDVAVAFAPFRPGMEAREVR